MMGLLVSLASGAIGGNIAGALMKDKSLGTLWNSVVGILGGGLGGQLLGLVGLGDAGGILGTIAGSTVGGAALPAIVGLFRNWQHRDCPCSRPRAGAASGQIPDV